MSFLRQQLPTLLMPFDISLILVLVGLIIRRRALLWTGVAVFWLSSTPFVGGLLVRVAEEWTERAPASVAPVVDAIVVLSAGRIIAPGRAAISEWDDLDCFFGGVELFQAGKAPLLVFTGAWQPSQPNAPLEGDVLAAYARAMGVPPDRIITTGRVSNTADEAQAVAALLRARQARPPYGRLFYRALFLLYGGARRRAARAGAGATLRRSAGWRVSCGRRELAVADARPRG